MYCKMCGKQLTTQHSIKKGFGPECSKKHQRFSDDNVYIQSTSFHQYDSYMDKHLKLDYDHTKDADSYWKYIMNIEDRCKVEGEQNRTQYELDKKNAVDYVAFETKKLIDFQRKSASNDPKTKALFTLKQREIEVSAKKRILQEESEKRYRAFQDETTFSIPNTTQHELMKFLQKHPMVKGIRTTGFIKNQGDGYSVSFERPLSTQEKQVIHSFFEEDKSPRNANGEINWKVLNNPFQKRNGDEIEKEMLGIIEDFNMEFDEYKHSLRFENKSEEEIRLDYEHDRELLAKHATWYLNKFGVAKEYTNQEEIISDFKNLQDAWSKKNKDEKIKKLIAHYPAEEQELIRRKIGRAKTYPFKIPDKSYIYFNGDQLELQSFDLEQPEQTQIIVNGTEMSLLSYLENNQLPTDDLFKKRIPVLAFGSNSAPDQLLSKYGHLNQDTLIPVVKAKLDDFDVVFSAHFSPYGAVPATLQHQKGVQMNTFITYLTEEQLEEMHKTEGLGTNYCYAQLDQVKLTLENGKTYDQIFSYQSLNGPLKDHNGQCVSLSVLNNLNRQNSALKEEEMLHYVKRELGCEEMDLDEFIIQNVTNAELRQKRGDELKKRNDPFRYPYWKKILG